MNPASNPVAPSSLVPVPARGKRSRGLVDELVAHLTASIHDGQLRPGDKLPTESDLVGRHEVSRTTVREAISKLQASGLVETRHGIGTFVIEPPPRGTFRLTPQDLGTAEDLIQVLELRISLETEAAGLAAQRRTAEQLQAMQSALDAFAEAVRAHSDAVPNDFQFHMEIARATGNRHFGDLMTYLGTMIIPRTRLNTPEQAPDGREAYLQRVHGEHESIFNAIRNQEPEAARAAMRTHLSNSRDRLRRARAEAA